MPDLGPTLVTDRLILRPPRAEDYDAYAVMCAEPETMRWIGGAQGPGMAWRTLAVIAGGWALDGFNMFMVFRKDTGAFIGRIGPQFPRGWPGREVGWGLIAAAHGQGFALEAAAASMDYAFDILGWDEAIHCIDEGNVPSQRLAERLGSRRLREGTLPDPINVRLTVWGQSRETWRARPANGRLRERAERSAPIPGDVDEGGARGPPSKVDA